MGTLPVNGISILLAAVVVGLAAWKWHIVKDRQSILSVMKLALNERRALWFGILAGVVYLAVFMILGGKGGRVHFLFGRLIWNTSPADVLTGLVLAILVAISMSLFAYGARLMGSTQSGKKGGIGFFGAGLALLASFCP
jgi:hypothetical protein